jgi:hypothetical protein
VFIKSLQNTTRICLSGLLLGGQADNRSELNG